MPIIQRQEIKGHMLASLKGDHIPRSWLFLDTETSQTVKDEITMHHFHVGWTCMWNRATDKYEENEDWTWFLSAAGINGYIQEMGLRYKYLHVVGHNIFFDLQAAGTFAFLTSEGWALNFYYDKGLTYILKCERSGVQMTFISSTNWFDQSLKSLGKVVGLEKLDYDFKHPDADKEKEYCYRDVEILVLAFRYYLQFITDNRFGKLCLTKASQAFTAYRFRFNDGKIFIHKHTDSHALERAAYMGGRTECFFIGECKGGPFQTMDVNSMYPFVMKKYRYPVKLLRYAHSPTLQFIKEVLPRYGVIAEVTLQTDDPAYAVRHKGKTVFPIGRFVTSLCTEGLKYAIARGHVHEVHRASIYQMADIFTKYVDYLYKMKGRYSRAKNETMVMLTKYMLNGLYGKFAQLEIINEKEDIGPSEDYSREVIFNLVSGHNTVITRLMNTEITQRTGGEGKNSNVAIAAHITENARFVLWEIIKPLGTDKVLYCDTDSIKIRKKYYDLIQWPKGRPGLGMLKIESRSRELFIEGSKNYRTEKGRRIKGIPERAKEIAPGVFSYQWFAGQITHLRKNIKVGARVEPMTRELSHKYDKGVVHDSGRVTPLFL